MEEIGETERKGSRVSGEVNATRRGRGRADVNSRNHPSHQPLDLLGHLLVRLLTILEDLSRLDVGLVVLEVLLLQTLLTDARTDKM